MNRRGVRTATPASPAAASRTSWALTTLLFLLRRLGLRFRLCRRLLGLGGRPRGIAVFRIALPVIRFVFLHDPGHVHHQIARRHVHDLHALRVAARNADALDRHADHDPFLGDHHQLVVGEHLLEGDDVARLVRTLQGDDARPPRCCTRYSSSSERLPMPFSVTVRSVDFRRTTTMSMTWSFLSSSIPFTPVAVRPMSRTSFSWNRMLMPWCVARTISLRPSVTCTSISSSPFSMLIARMPTERGLPNSDSRVFFTTPCLVANSRYWSSENSRTGTKDARRSSGFMAMQLTIGFPRAARAACGISCTLSQ